MVWYSIPVCPIRVVIVRSGFVITDINYVTVWNILDLISVADMLSKHNPVIEELEALTLSVSQATCACYLSLSTSKTVTKFVSFSYSCLLCVQSCRFRAISPPKFCAFLCFFHVTQSFSPIVPSWWFPHYKNTAWPAHITKFHIM